MGAESEGIAEEAVIGKRSPVPGRLEFQDGFGTGTDVEFVVDVPKMPADGVIGKAEAGGDLFVGMALGQQFKDVAFASGEAFDFGGCGYGFLKRGDYFAGDFT